MDAPKTEMASSEADFKESADGTLVSDSTSGQGSSIDAEKNDQPSETAANSCNTSENGVSQNPGSTQVSQAESPVSGLKPAAEVTSDHADADQSASLNESAIVAAEPPVPSQLAADPVAVSGDDSCYRYDGETCIYTDPSSGVEYVYSADQEGWVRRDGGGDGQPVHAPTLENCYYVGEHYCFKDAAGTVYRLDPESNSWREWSPPAESAPPAAGADSAGGQGERCFRGSDGAWCCRDDSGALCRWDAAAGRWLRADSDAGAAAGTGRRKRRLNRGSSDDSEHDSDEEDEPAAKRAPAADGAPREEPEPPSDGSGYEWDAEKGAWFPKIDEEFLALHRLNYGFDSEGRAVETAPILETAPPSAEPPPPEKQEAGKQRKLSTKKKPEWFQLDDSKNTKVYVSGLAEDTTEDEFVELMSKCGLVMKDPLKKNAWKIKLYRDDYGVPKGDGICTYIKIESVNLALSILDGSEFKGKRISVEKATFDMKGKFDPTKKPKKKTLKKKDREKLQKKQEKLFAWQPDKIRGERERHERVVILRNLFTPEEFKTRPEAILEYQQDLRDECGKFGPVRKVVLHDRHKEGVAEVIFQEAVAADSCVQKMNGRWFAGRRLEAATWDGKTKYRVEETEEERAERLAKWEQFISGEEKPSDDKPPEEKSDGPPERKTAGHESSEDKTDADKPGGENTAEKHAIESRESEEKPA